jgi:hypothetical protein
MAWNDQIRVHVSEQKTSNATGIVAQTALLEGDGVHGLLVDTAEEWAATWKQEQQALH